MSAAAVIRYSLYTSLASYIGIAVFLCMTAFACELLNEKLGLEDDNLIEEWSEDYLYDKSGFRVDLTPTSPENL
jgi:hypothetical protein